MANKNSNPIQETTNSKDYEIKISESPIQSSNRFPSNYSSKLQTSCTNSLSPYFIKNCSEHLLFKSDNMIEEVTNKILQLKIKSRQDQLRRLQKGKMKAYEPDEEAQETTAQNKKCVLTKNDSTMRLEQMMPEKSTEDINLEDIIYEEGPALDPWYEYDRPGTLWYDHWDFEEIEMEQPQYYEDVSENSDSEENLDSEENRRKNFRENLRKTMKTRLFRAALQQISQQPPPRKWKNLL